MIRHHKMVYTIFMNDNEETSKIKSWLGTGSINILGLPYSGKDTVGKRLASDLDAEFLSSGDLLRAVGEEVQESGKLSPTNIFYDVVLPAFARPELVGKSLVLSSIGRWYGEEKRVIEVANTSEHPIKAVILLKISEDEVTRRWKTSFELGDRDNRSDATEEKIAKRLEEFKNKTLPVVETYRELGLLVEINGEQSRDEVYAEVIKKLVNRASTSR